MKAGLGKGLTGERVPAAPIGYVYTDEHNVPLYRVVRRTGYPPFYTQRYEGGNLLSGIDGVRRVPYRLPRVLGAIGQGQDIHVVDGEKDVDAIEAAGEVATCCPFGMNRWDRALASHLEGATIVLVRDRGEYLSEDAISLLSEYSQSLRIVEAREGKDSHDHLSAGYALHEFVELGVPSLPIGPDAHRRNEGMPWADTVCEVSFEDLVSRPEELRGERLVALDACDEFVEAFCDHLDLPAPREGARASDNFRCPVHDEWHASANLWRDERGIWVMRCHHHRDPDRESFCLAEVYAAHVSGDREIWRWLKDGRRGLPSPALAYWHRRMLVDFGLVDCPEIELAPLPPTASANARSFREGLALLLQVRALTEPADEPFPCTKGFMAGWTGLTKWQAERAKVYLLDHGILVKVGSHHRMNLYRAGTARIPDERSGWLRQEAA